MIGTIFRAIANGIAASLKQLMTDDFAHWADAMSYEIRTVPDDWAALLFAFGCLWTALRHSVPQRTYRTTVTPTSAGKVDLMTRPALARSPRISAIICASAAVALGAFYMMSAGAPTTYIASNFIALAVGIAAVCFLARAIGDDERILSWLPLVGGAGLLATALFGISLEGASRWFAAGPFFLQTSLILVPLMIMAFARQHGPLPMIGMVLAAIALALQPDRAMAGVLLAGLLVVTLYRPEKWALLAISAAAVGMIATMLRPDTLPAVPYVDRILFSSFDVSLFAGLAVIVGTALLLVPSLSAASDRAESRVQYIAFGVIWLAIIAAAALGNYPTPVVGFGGSAVLGYLLSAMVLPKKVSQSASIFRPVVEESSDSQSVFRLVPETSEPTLKPAQISLPK